MCKISLKTLQIKNALICLFSEIGLGAGGGLKIKGLEKVKLLYVTN